VEVNSKLFPDRESVVSDIPAGYGKIANFFLQCRNKEGDGWTSVPAPTLGYSDYDVSLESDRGSLVYRCKK
jgi:hypothetical protein